MPEGDTVYRTASQLRELDGQVLLRSDFRIPSLATRDLKGRAVITTISRGKHLLTRIEGDVTVHSHLKMEGSWQIRRPGSPLRGPTHTIRAVLGTARHEAVGFQVLLDLLHTSDEERVVGHLGPDLLGPDWDPAEALRRLRSSPETPVADALLEQRNLAGIGNVYKSELCFIGGVHPSTPVGEVDNLDRIVSLAREMLILNKDRGNRVTTGSTRRGQTTWVYGRRGPCLRCGTPIRSDAQGPAGRERTTWWCPSCQPTA